MNLSGSSSSWLSFDFFVRWTCTQSISASLRAEIEIGSGVLSCGNAIVCGVRFAFFFFFHTNDMNNCPIMTWSLSCLATTAVSGARTQPGSDLAPQTTHAHTRITPRCKCHHSPEAALVAALSPLQAVAWPPVLFPLAASPR